MIFGAIIGVIPNNAINGVVKKEVEIMVLYFVLTYVAGFFKQ